MSVMPNLRRSGQVIWGLACVVYVAVRLAFTSR
jgi:hypothetical protein